MGMKRKKVPPYKQHRRTPQRFRQSTQREHQDLLLVDVDQGLEEVVCVLPFDVLILLSLWKQIPLPPYTHNKHPSKERKKERKRGGKIIKQTNKNMLQKNKESQIVL
jgi:hypothetical protein